MSRISDTRIRTREAAARLVAAGRRPHELTVDLIYAEIRQGSRTTINDELKLWKDEQVRNDALAAALPAPVADAMRSLWALAVEHGEHAFAARGEELEHEAADATARAESLATALAALEAQGQTLRMQLEERETRLAAAATELARTQAERDAARTAAQETQHAAEGAHARELEALRTEHAEREAALRVQIDQAASRLESVQKHVMLQTEEARDAQRRAETALAKVRQRNEQLVGDVQRLSAEAAEQRRLADRHEKQLASVIDEARELRRERDTLAQQVASLQGQLKARPQPASSRPSKTKP
ncbi:DNA-binding protein [Burkholderia ubonensis]|uniref:DNA-binding protein n=1 Tax=Burkholderia ubonensis TaxID=101571 RepID=UPI0007524E1C|nr:DNA-binding protein [Burkholderia ubonensis]KVD77434.1 integrase [Burkholderia ubonensis]